MIYGFTLLSEYEEFAWDNTDFSDVTNSSASSVKFQIEGFFSAMHSSDYTFTLSDADSAVLYLDSTGSDPSSAVSTSSLSYQMRGFHVLCGNTSMS